MKIQKLVNALHMQNRLFINGQWVDSKSGQLFDIHNPANGESIASIANADIDDASAAVLAAQQALALWRQTPAKDKSQRLRRWFDLINAHQEELATLLTLEQGKPLSEAKGEVGYGASFIEWFAEEAKRIQGDILPAPKADQRILVSKEAIGVCALITPWNFPVAMITRKAAAALAAGCTVIIKPAEDTPLCALALAALAEQAGIPPGVINVIPTTHAATVGKFLCDHPDVKKLSFTGSTEVGKLLMAQSAATLKKLSLELGGNAPFIVFEDCDLDAAVAGAMAAKFRNAGQTCICTNRFLVQRSIQKEFTQRLHEQIKHLIVGDGLHPDTQQGPLINEAAVQKVELHISDACHRGATLLLGGKRWAADHTFFQPTLIDNVPVDALIHKEETFGPVAAITPFDSESDAIRIANNTEFGLAAYAYTRDLGRAMRLASTLEYGMVGINEGIISNEVAPFGGVKSSGFGREGSRYGVEEYLTVKYTLLGGL